MAELNPLVLELLGEPARSPTRPDPWRFSAVTGAPLSAGATLAELGVLDGETLRLGPAAPPPPAPVLDDPVDALAALTPRRRHGRRGPEIAAVGPAPGAAAPLAAVRAGGNSAEPVGGAVALGGVGAIAALVGAARVARHIPGDDEGHAALEWHEDDRGPAGARTAALVPAYCAVPLAAAAGWAASPGPPGASHLLLAVVAGGGAPPLGQIALPAAGAALVAAPV